MTYPLGEPELGGGGGNVIKKKNYCDLFDLNQVWFLWKWSYISDFYMKIKS